MMNNKKIKYFWVLEYCDFDLISKYINEKAGKGEALECIGNLFATYKKTQVYEYQYCVDYLEDLKKNSEEFALYKKTWLDEGWEYVDFLDEMIFFRRKNQGICVEPLIDLDEIKVKILHRFKDECKTALLAASVIIFLAGLNIFLQVSEYKFAWTIILIFELLQFELLFRYTSLKKVMQMKWNFDLRRMHLKNI